MFPSLLQPDFQNRRRLFWQAQALGWGTMCFMPFLLLQGGELPGRDALLVGLVRAFLGLGISTLLLRPPLHLARRRRMPVMPAGIVGVAYCLALGWLDMTLTLGILESFGMDRADLSLYAETSWLLRGLAYAVWCLLYYAIHYWLDTQEARLRLANLQAEQRTVELLQLRAQVNPHFLFNVFSSILAEADNPKAVTTLAEGMAEFLRFSLRQTGALQPLGEELVALDHYLRVEKVRFEDRFEYTIDASPDARKCRVPGPLLQPLVENAVKYGQRTSTPPLRLAIQAATERRQLIVTVANTGRWARAGESLFPTGNGIGLANLRRRLELVYGADAKCDWHEADGWVRVELRMPAEART